MRDTGPDIAEADHERIFGEFQQIETARTLLVVFVLLLGAAMFTQGNLNPGEREVVSGSRLSSDPAAVLL